ncbi:MAG: TadE family type IV pilus minor pilin [Propionibacteriaceae bacterium]|nr:TadE family type IV pilus minor pilin [Propionibacteriaceae bacterium]
MTKGNGMRPRTARGMVTLELALSLISLLLATAAGLWVVAVLGQQVRLADTAREVARQLARGDAVAARQAAQRGPAGLTVTSQRVEGDVVVRVQLSSSPLGALPSVPLSAEARVAAEPGTEP